MSVKLEFLFDSKSDKLECLQSDVTLSFEARDKLIRDIVTDAWKSLTA